jgi:hypothetical protein
VFRIKGGRQSQWYRIIQGRKDQEATTYRIPYKSDQGVTDVRTTVGRAA